MSRKTWLQIDPRDHDTLREHGARYVRRMLDDCGGNKSLACLRLGITYHTLRKYVEMPLYPAGVDGEPSRDA